ncbi:hypothetical protein HXX76_011210 [Chlamydomonas incerta]|uniref:EML-like second beta-propeller domain-containing protein n=1 Tax=Chlamydomonas incerta TaxID=51695 RepID=A0A835VXS5_CHLIN|nr:hypothetical protein HXX76_011210 [Chlamydomonas incerta]|eukprot:KAG2428966.1 hypothetical protein HXX76_011210 [Chlamydomonas incerta]
MAESLGGSRGRNDNILGKAQPLGKTGGFGQTQGLGRTGAPGRAGGLLDRPTSARLGPDRGPPARTGAMAAVLGGGQTQGRATSASRQRPASAPRIYPTAPRTEEGAGWTPGGKVQEDLLRAKQRDLPAFWSVRAHGQPFNDERLGNGAANFYRLAQPAGLDASRDATAGALGPATMQQAAMRKSLETGKRHFTTLEELQPLDPRERATQPLSDADREYLLQKLTPYQRIHALYHCLDKNPATSLKEWIPWPMAILNRATLHAQRVGLKPPPAKYDLEDWKGGPAQVDMLMRLATTELEYMMRRHLKFMSDRECNSARAPAALEKDILRHAFWRVDPQRTGAVSIQQFLQVWQNLLRLMEYDDVWVKKKDAHGKTKHTQVLQPKRLVLLDRNMAAALFVKHGFDKDGLMPYVVFINALCSTPARLLGHEVVLDKKSRGKNGLEDDLDISLCLGNAKIKYRYCEQGVFPPGEFSAAMGRRSFHPPKAHMWLEHVYGYAGMLDYTRQSNVFYTHNTGKALSPVTEAAVKKRLAETQHEAGGPDTVRAEGGKRVEFVYYTGSVGIVFDKEKYDAGVPCQRYFFGHNNDIQCLTMHPNRRWVATGQQKATGDMEVPYVCVWDVDQCMQLQRLDHGRDERGVIALAFSGDHVDGKGGDLLLTVTSDDRHLIHVWRWMPHSNKYINAHYIPGWFMGPEKKITPLRMKGDVYFSRPHELRDGEYCEDSWLNKFPFDADNWSNASETKLELDKAEAARRQQEDPEYQVDPAAQKMTEFLKVKGILDASREEPPLMKAPAWEAPAEWWKQSPEQWGLTVPTPGTEKGPNPMWSFMEHPDFRVRAEDADGFYHEMRRVRREDGALNPQADEEKLRMPHHEQDLQGCNGTPPMVYGLVWNRLRPSDGRRGSEFASYGVKHLKTWIADEKGTFIGTQGSFAKFTIENVLSAVYVPAMHAMRSPGDSCILTGFASGNLGLWVPPYPTRAGATYTLVKYFPAHSPGKPIALNDGTQVPGGIRALRLRRTKAGVFEVLSGGADGCVRCWQLDEVAGARPDGTPMKGVKLTQLPLGRDDAAEIKLMPPSNPLKKAEEPPIVVALDAHEDLDREFLAGTNGCDIWEVDADPRVLVEGHEEDLDEVAAHPEEPHTFATACSSGKVRVWDARRRDVVRCADMGYPLMGIAFSQEHLTFVDPENKANRSHGYHLAVSGDKGQLTVMQCDTLRPLIHHQVVPSRQYIPELKYSPRGGPKMLAAAAADLTVYLYRADRNYQLLCKCMGHSGTVQHVDWSLPVDLGGTPFDGKFAIQSCDSSGDMLYWDPYSGKKLPYNMRDVEWHTWTLRVGFDVMGIWPDGSDGTDINSVDRCRLGAPIYDPFEAEYEQSTEAAMHYSDRDSADGISGAGYLVTADDFSLVKLFNYPVVADDAPFKAFRGHASHVTSVRHLADDQVVVSVGGHDRGIFQWRTCGVASGLPPLPVIYQLLKKANEDIGYVQGPDGKPLLRDPEAAKEARHNVWEALHKRARAFRSYERLKLYAMRLAVEEKRVNSMAGAVPQPKLPDLNVWTKIPGTNQYASIRRDQLTEEQLKEAGASPTKRHAAMKAGSGGGAATPVGGSPAAAGNGKPVSVAGGSKRASGTGTPRTGGGGAVPAGGTSGLSDTYGEEDSYALSAGDSATFAPSGPRQAAARTPSVRTAASAGGGSGAATPRTEGGASTSGAALGGVGGRSKRYSTQESVVSAAHPDVSASIAEDVDEGVAEEEGVEDEF